jgi:MFS family permease
MMQSAEESAATRGAHLRVALACLLGNMLSPLLLIHVSLGQFLIPVSHEFQWPRQRVSGVLTLLALVSAVAYPMVGRLADRFGPRKLILIGLLGAGSGVLALGFATRSVLIFYAMFAVVGAFGSLSSTMIYNQVISRWFDRARGRMLGLTAGLGNGLGAAIMPFAVLILMSDWGWRAAFFGLGLIEIAVGLPAILFLLQDAPRRARGQAPSADDLPGMTLEQAVRTSSFWLTLIAICLGAGCLTAVLAHVVPILTDRHFPVSQATLVVSLFAMVGAGWMVVVGLLLDKIDSPRIIVPLYLISVLGVLALERGTTLTELVAGGVMMGIGLGTEYAALSYFISRYFGLRRFGLISGVMYSAVTIAQGATPYLMDVDFDRHRSYLLSLHLIEGALVLGAAFIACLPRYEAIKAWPQKVKTASTA